MNEVESIAYGIFSRSHIGRKLLIDYDEAEDVLYINYLNSAPTEADNATQVGDYIVRFRNQRVVGLTIINALEHSKSGFEDSPKITPEKELILA